jgi:hypothetical protein
MSAEQVETIVDLAMRLSEAQSDLNTTDNLLRSALRLLGSVHDLGPIHDTERWETERKSLVATINHVYVQREKRATSRSAFPPGRSEPPENTPRKA